MASCEPKYQDKSRVAMRRGRLWDDQFDLPPVSLEGQHSAVEDLRAPEWPEFRET